MVQAPALAFPAAAPCGQPRQSFALAAVLMAMALVVVDAAMINVSLPTIGKDLGVTAASSVRLVSAYQTAVVMALLPCAALGERFGSRRIFAAGLVLFMASSALGACAPSLTWLAAVRFLQGLGAAAIMALGVALLRDALPAERIGAAIGWNALTVAVASAAGPALGALVVSVSGWQLLFLVHLPLGFAAFLASRALPQAAASRKKLDGVSIGLSGAGFVSLIFGAETLATEPRFSVALLASSALAFSILLRRELPKESPLIPIYLLRIRTFRRSVLASICCFTGQTAGLLALPFYLNAVGEGPLMTGLYLTPWPLAAGAAALVSGRLEGRFTPSSLCTAGGLLLSAGLVGSALLPLEEASLPLIIFTTLCGLGFGLFQVPNNQAMFLSAPITRSAAAGGMHGTARLMGQTAGAVLTTLLFTWAPILSAPRFGLAVGAAFALTAAAIIAPKRESDAGGRDGGA